MSNTWWYIKPHEPPYSITSKDLFDQRMFDESAKSNVRGPFVSPEDAEENRYHDHLEGYWSAGMAVYADHCVGCGKYAKILAFDNQAGGWAWRVTECKHCGVLDSRVHHHSKRVYWPAIEDVCGACGQPWPCMDERIDYGQD